MLNIFPCNRYTQTRTAMPQDSKPGLIPVHLANHRMPAYNFQFNSFIIIGLRSKEQVFEKPTHRLMSEILAQSGNCCKQSCWQYWIFWLLFGFCFYWFLGRCNASLRTSLDTIAKCWAFNFESGVGWSSSLPVAQICSVCRLIDFNCLLLAEWLND